MAYGVDRILSNGKIITVDGAFAIVEAVAIHGGRFVAAGSNDDIRNLAGPDTVDEDLGGAWVMPGIIDAHNHLLSTSQGLQQVQLYDCRTIGEVLERVRRRAIDARPGEWILGKGWDETLLAEGRYPTRWELDEVAPENPVVMHRVWNKLTANSAAIEAAGVSRETPDPPADMLYAGGFDRDPDTGEPMGLFRDRAKALILNAVPAPSNDDLAGALKGGSQAYNAVGLTGIADPGLLPHQLRAYQTARERGDLTVRSNLLLATWGMAPVEMEPKLKDWIGGYGIYGRFGDDLLRLEGAKILLDGGVGDRTGRMYEPYADEPDNYGQWSVDPDEFPEHVRFLHDQGFSIDTHTCGTAATDLAIKAFIAAQSAAPNPGVRHRVHHAYFPTDEAMELMAAHNIPALVSSPFLVNLGDSFVNSVGSKRAAKAIPMASYLKAGVKLVGSSDAPITDFNPFVGLYASVARTTVQGQQLDMSEAISREDAIRSYTIAGAYATQDEHIKGSIETGKLADLIVLDRDPLTCSDEELRDTLVMRTMLGGKWVYER